MTDHCDEELPRLLNGELGGDATRSIARHLRVCDTCVESLIATAIAFGSLQAVRRVDAELGLGIAGSIPSAHQVTEMSPINEVTQPPLRRRRSTSSRNVTSLAAAAVLIGLVVVGLNVFTNHPSSPRVSAVASLRHLAAPASASGSVVVHLAGTIEHMSVSTSGLPKTSANQFYEVWLFQPSDNKMLPLGILAPNGKATFSVTSHIMSQFSAVDISLQTNDGNPAHSKTSVLRGPVTST